MINYKSLLVVLLLVGISFAQANDGSALLEKLQDKYNTIDDFSSSFRQRTKDGHVATGKFYYKAEDKYRIELKSRTIVSDGESIWNYTERGKKVIITPSDDAANSFSVEDYVFNFPKKCTVTATRNDESRQVLILKPKDSDLDFEEINIIVNDDYLIDKMVLTDLMNNVFTVELKDTKVNQNLSDKLFSFQIPQGTKVIDLR